MARSCRNVVNESYEQNENIGLSVMKFRLAAYVEPPSALLDGVQQGMGAKSG